MLVLPVTNAKKIELNELCPDMLKCLMFVQGLSSSTDAEIHSCILTKLEQNPKLVLQWQKNVKEYQIEGMIL